MHANLITNTFSGPLDRNTHLPIDHHARQDLYTLFLPPRLPSILGRHLNICPHLSLRSMAPLRFLGNNLPMHAMASCVRLLTPAHRTLHLFRHVRLRL